MLNFEKPSHTIEDLMALPEDTRAELIDGEIVMMAPVAASHAEICAHLIIEAGSYLKNKKGPKDVDFWRILTEAWTYYDELNSFVHDIAGFSRQDLPKLPGTGPIHAKPIWVCEILSPSNQKNDTLYKKKILEQYQVPYYWIVDPRKKTITVNQVIYSLGPKISKVRLAPFEDLELDLAKIFDI